MSKKELCGKQFLLKLSNYIRLIFHQLVVKFKLAKNSKQVIK